MMGEKIFTMGIGMLVSVLVARHLGPEEYGILSYAISLASLFGVATHMGLQGLAVRELVEYSDYQEELMGTIFGLKFFGSVTATLAFLLFIFNTGDVGSVEFWVLLVASGTILMKPFQVFDFWFQAEVKAKYSSKVRGIATIVLSIAKVGLVLIGAKVLAFAWAYLFQALLIAALFLLYFAKVANISLSKWKFKFNKAKELLGDGWMLMLGALFSMLYLKIDQAMLRWLVNTKEVGIYSVSVKLSEAWYFIPIIIVASVFPKLIELREKDKQGFEKRLQQLFDFLFSMALSLAILITFISSPLIDFLYGAEYEKASFVLSIHIWAGVFMFMRAVFSKWILIEDAIVISLVTQGLGTLSNIILNLLLIPSLGGVGAAIASLISYATASYFSLFFYEKSRKIFWMMSKSLVYPFRLIYRIVK